MEDTYEGWEEDYKKGWNYEPTPEEDAIWEEENNLDEGDNNSDEE